MHAVLAWGLLMGTLGGFADRRAVVVTTDMGTEVDDLWAVAHLILSPEVEVKGVVSTHAPNLPDPAAEASSKYVGELMEHVPQRFRVPVMAGSSKKLLDASKPLPNPGVDFLLEQSKGFGADRRLVVVVLGAATDVASAILTDPTWVDRVSIVAMGFDSYPKGGDPWNVKNDPVAWRILLDSRAPITVGDVEVTRRHLGMTPDRAHTLLALLGEPAGLLLERLDIWLARNAAGAQRETGSPITWPIWDEVATAVILGMAQTETRPRPRLQENLGFNLENPTGTIEWVKSIDEGKLWSDLVAKLRAAAPPR